MKRFYARQFGLPPEQIKFFDELTEAQQGEVGRLFNLVNPGNYVYAVKRDGGLVWRRENRDFLREADWAEAEDKRCNNPRCHRMMPRNVDYCCRPCRMAHEGGYSVTGLHSPNCK